MKGILLAGLAAGILDISYAFTKWGLRGVAPIRILHSVASGLLGKDAFTGGVPVAALGLLLHFLVALLAAAGFYLLFRSIPQVSRWPLPSGVLYGAAFYFVMTYAVVPLSRAQPIAFNTIDLLGHMFLIGLPIAAIIAAIIAAPPGRGQGPRERRRVVT